ncbi:MAG: ABC transporter ATP-binding protein [Planctomycetes bacterium]|uniref:ABC transporter ATP-binding protein n=1 Tax=uncultured Gimesia sp. TaxID=1678688 RepID=UPI00261A825B|nr:ABC transporter ATP-binding protein [uncultured Gimesia sp.]MCH9653062.1 ABC transporter ATP-binding protein [Planctomycetota bacterium]MCH9723986.1 ABC transporter ATP-binding protein [Planctomycetota bacterium]MCH9774871.1 ABC transporter ATP-binding protein [Planctomycetota bacterium]
MSTTIIQVADLHKQFKDNQVLTGLDLQIEAGQIVGLLGTNGSGKSTLIKCLLGLLRPTSGTSSVFNENSWDLSAKSKSRLGYVSQEYILLPWMTVKAMTEYTGAFYEHWDYDYVNVLLKEWNLDEKQRVGALSVGQRQKLAVILALGHHPELLILDEPVASLDPVARRQFLQSLIEFTEEEENTILFSTHITSDLERVASHVVFLQEGIVGFSGELDSLKGQVKRIRITAEQDLPLSLNLPGTLRSQVDGKHALLAVKDFQAEVLETLSKDLNATFTIEDLNLEEIFLELSGVSSLTEEEITL